MLLPGRQAGRWVRVPKHGHCCALLQGQQAWRWLRCDHQGEVLSVSAHADVELLVGAQARLQTVSHHIEAP